MEFLNRNFALTFGANIKKLLRAKPPDCCLFSESGSQFKIHRELLGQTTFLRKIANSAKDCCNVPIEIFCPCSDKELSILVEFLYTGKMICDDVEVLSKSIDNLKEIFGFPNELPLWPEDQEFANDTPIDKIANFSIKEEQFDQEENIDTNQNESDDTDELDIDSNIGLEIEKEINRNIELSNGKENNEDSTTTDFSDLSFDQKDDTNLDTDLVAAKNLLQIDHENNFRAEKPKKKVVSKRLKTSKKFSCYDCAKSFAYEQIKKYHVQRVHQKKKSVGSLNGKDTYEEAVKEMLHQNENVLVNNFENSEIEDWEGFIQENYDEKIYQNQPQSKVSKEVSAIEPAKKKMKMTYDFSESIDHDSNLYFNVVKNCSKPIKLKSLKKLDKTDAKYICEECQKEGCRLYCIGIHPNMFLKHIGIQN